MRSSLFFIFFTVFLLIIGAASAFIVSTIRLLVPQSMQGLHTYLWIPFAVFPILLIATTTLSNFAYFGWTKPLYVVSSLWLPALIYLFIGALIIRFYLLLGTNIQIIPAQILGLILLVIFTALMTFGVYKATTYQVVTHEIEAPELHDAWSNKKIVLFSDSHLGLSRGEMFTKKIVSTINELAPDAVFIAGDLIDGPIIPYTRDLAPLKDIKSTYGTFYAAGNHDEYNREQLKYLDALSKTVTVLNDKKIIVNDTQIIGIEYATEPFEGTTARLINTGYEADVPSIVILHDPKNVPALAEAGTSLSFSGHTHGGQFWPFSMIVNSIYKDLTKGTAYVGKHAHFTTVGVGTWGPLFRLGTQPEIVVIKIK